TQYIRKGPLYSLFYKYQYRGKMLISKKAEFNCYKIRQAFIAASGNSVIVADYGQ
ncbi:hypothetical protein S245_016529, partial [Arachis hypogaea]